MTTSNEIHLGLNRYQYNFEICLRCMTLWIIGSMRPEKHRSHISYTKHYSQYDQSAHHNQCHASNCSGPTPNTLERLMPPGLLSALPTELLVSKLGGVFLDKTSVPKQLNILSRRVQIHTWRLLCSSSLGSIL